MPVKKKGGKKKRMGKSSKDDSESEPASAEPQTMMSDADVRSIKSGKKKKKKTKLSSAEKEKAKLDKLTDGLKKDKVKFYMFVDRVDKWLQENQKKAVELFRTVDADQDESVSFDDFKAGMMDLNVPLNQVELHLLCQLLEDEEDEAEERIAYEFLTDGLAIVREREESYEVEDIRPAIQVTKRDFEHCPCCKLALWDGDEYKQPYPRYVDLRLRLIPFMHMKRHPGNFTRIVHSHITTIGLIQLIQEITYMQSTHVFIYWQFERNNPEHDRNPNDLLPMEGTLEDMGVNAGSKLEPEPLVLYYDYKVDFTECPILLADHYFSSYQSVGIKSALGDKSDRESHRTPRE